MTRIVVLPNENLCPEGAVVEAEPGESICRALLRNDIEIGLVAVVHVTVSSQDICERVGLRGGGEANGGGHGNDSEHLFHGISP